MKLLGRIKAITAKIAQGSGLVVAVLILVPTPGVAAYISSTPYVVSSVSAMQAVGAASAQYPTLTLKEYAAGYGSLGGGTFNWSSSNLSSQVASDPLHCKWVPPSTDTTGASGAYVRQLPSGNLLPEFCGASSFRNANLSDNAAAFNAVFTLCGTYGWDVKIPGDRYKFWGSTTVSIPTNCNWHGIYMGPTLAIANNTYLDFQNNTNTTAKAMVSIAGTGGTNTYDDGGSYQGVVIIGSAANTQIPLLNIQNDKEYVARDIYLYGAKYQCVTLGFAIEWGVDQLTARNCGDSTHSMIDVDNFGGTNATTTGYLTDVSAETAGVPTKCGISINRTRNTQIADLVAETGQGTQVCVGDKTESTVFSENIVFDTGDLEASTTSYDVEVCQGWTGTAGGCALGLTFRNIRDSSTNAALVARYRITNTTGLSVRDHITYSQGGQTDFLFTGTNKNAEIGRDLEASNAASGGTYVSVGGVTATAASPYAMWRSQGTGDSIGVANTATTDFTLTPGTDASVQNFTGALAGDIACTLTAPVDTNTQPSFTLINNTTGAHNITCAGATLAAGAQGTFKWLGAAYVRVGS